MYDLLGEVTIITGKIKWIGEVFKLVILGLYLLLDNYCGVVDVSFNFIVSL